MTAVFGVYGLSFIAGILSILSPCVLPLIPILVSTALNTHQYAPYTLALGLAISFTFIGVFIAMLGASIGINQEIFRLIAAVFLMIFGVVLISSTLQEKFTSSITGISSSGNYLLSKVSTGSLSGQFILGLLLGVIWSPCVGPVLGAAITLASQGANLDHVIIVMALFGLGAGLPLILLGLLSRQAMMKVKSKLFIAGKVGKRLLGVILLIVGLLITSGLDKQFEALIVTASPDWLITLTTKY